MKSCDGPAASSPSARRSPRSPRGRDRAGAPPSSSCDSRAGRRSSTGSPRRASARRSRPPAARTRGSAASTSSPSSTPGVHARRPHGRPAAQLRGHLRLVRGGHVGEARLSSSGARRMTSRKSAQQLARARSAGYRTQAAEHLGPTGCSANSSAVDHAEVAAAAAQRPEAARGSRPPTRGRSRRPAVTSSAASRLSQARPCLRSSQPEPPPSVRPRRRSWRPARRWWPGRERCAARSKSPQVAPPPTRATRRSGSISMSLMPRTSRTRPSSHERQPGDGVAAGADGDAGRARGRTRAPRSRRRAPRSAATSAGRRLDHRVEERAGVLVAASPGS